MQARASRMPVELRRKNRWGGGKIIFPALYLEPRRENHRAPLENPCPAGKFPTIFAPTPPEFRKMPTLLHRPASS